MPIPEGPLFLHNDDTLLSDIVACISSCRWWQYIPDQKDGRCHKSAPFAMGSDGRIVPLTQADVWSRRRRQPIGPCEFIGGPWPEAETSSKEYHNEHP
jgi:hypothetical protein